jgi:hypothetical protein
VLSDVTVRLPPLDVIVDHWPQIEQHLRRATSRNGCYEPIDLLAMAFKGEVGIWVCESGTGIDAAFVTWIKDYPRRRVLEIAAGGGSNMKEWIEPLKTALDQHARETGCNHIASTARKGWLRAFGAEATGDIQMVRSLEDIP